MYAFPSGHNPKTGTQESGMTLRDYFAAKAMQAYFTDEAVSWDAETQKIGVSRAYQLADFMMEARNGSI